MADLFEHLRQSVARGLEERGLDLPGEVAEGFALEMMQEAERAMAALWSEAASSEELERVMGEEYDLLRSSGSGQGGVSAEAISHAVFARLIAEHPELIDRDELLNRIRRQ